MSQLLDSIRAGRHQHSWSPVLTRYGGHYGRFEVSTDAVMVDDVRHIATAAEAQEAADLLGAVLPTPKLLDLRYQQADVHVDPQPQQAGPHMADLSAVVAHSSAVDVAIAGRSGMVADVGKHWVLRDELWRSPGKAVLYGWHVPHQLAGTWRGIRVYASVTDPTEFVVQPVSAAHNLHHADYSSTVVLCHGECEVDGRKVRTADVLTDPDLCGLLLASRRPLQGARLPDVSKVAPVATEPVWPVLSRGSAGSGVVAWQRVLLAARYDLGPCGADGKFGPRTHNATVAWQADRLLARTGIVSEACWKAAGSVPTRTTEPQHLDLAAVPFVQARYYKKANRSAVDWIVLHSAEIAEASTSAEALAHYCQTMSDGRIASWHYAVDCDSIVQSVREPDIAFGVSGANAMSIHIELSGYARQSAAEWQDRYSSQMLELAARLVAAIAARWHIPLEFVDSDGLKAGRRGVTTHAQATMAFRKSTHMDPGPAFPMTGFLQRCLAAA